MRGCAEEHDEERPPPTDLKPLRERQGATAQQERESQRVREAAVPEERPVRNAEDESQRVDIGQNGAERRNPQQALRGHGAARQGAHGERDGWMREDRGHRCLRLG